MKRERQYLPATEHALTALGAQVAAARREAGSRLVTALAAAPDFLLTVAAARAVIDDVVDAIRQHWDAACDQARLTDAERNGLWRPEILNGYVFEGYAGNE